MALTRLQIKDYTKAIIGEDDSKNIRNTLLNQFINFSIRELQQDLVKLGVKVFIKESYQSGRIATVPSDIMGMPNSIIAVLSSTGEKASVVQSFTAVSAVITLVEPGDVEWTINLTTNSSYTIPALYSINYTTKTVTIYLYSGTTTGAALNTLFTTNLELKNLFDITITGSGAVTLPTTPTTVLHVTAGSGIGWQPTVELSIETYNDIETNVFTQPTSYMPYYKRSSNASGTAKLEFLPKSVTYSKIDYYYKLADLTSDSDTVAIPLEYEEALIKLVAIKCYSKLKEMALADGKTVEYQNTILKLSDDYKQLLYSRQADKDRLLTQIPND